MTDNEDFSLIKRELVDRVGTLESKVDTLIASVDKNTAISELRLREIESTAKTLYTTVNGDGKVIGLTEKVRGIEGVFKHVYGIWAAVLAGFVEFIYRHIGSR